MRIRFLLAAFFLTLPLMADTVYTYTGNDFTFVSGPFTTSDSITGWFSVASPLGDSLSDPAVTLTGFSFSDGVNTDTSAQAQTDVPFIQVTTGATGDITHWDVAFDFDSDLQIQTSNVFGDYSQTNFGSTNVADNSGVPGTWAVSTTASGPSAPEPGTLVLFGTGLAALAMWRRRFRLRS